MSVLSQITGNIANAAGVGSNPSKVTPIPVNKQYSDLVNQQSNLANSYMKNLPSTQGQLNNISQDQGRQQLQQGYIQANQAANQRGLLYGGIGAGIRGNVESQIAGNTANNIQQNNLGTQAQGIQMQNTAVGSGIQQQNMQQQAYNQAYNQALANRQQAQQQQGNLLGGLGSIVGSVLGSGGGGTPTTTLTQGEAMGAGIDAFNNGTLSGANASRHYG